LADNSGYVYGVLPNGTLLWQQQVPNVAFQSCSPVLFAEDQFLIGDFVLGNIYLFNSTSGNYTIAVNNSLQLTSGSVIYSQMVWGSGVLYVAYDNPAHLTAYDTTNSSQLTLLWSLPLPEIATTWGAGPSIALDGTIYLSSDSFSFTVVSLLALGCPIGQLVNSNGTSCMAAPPTAAPIVAPTAAPTSAPTATPTAAPTTLSAPSSAPSSTPSLAPSSAPSTPMSFQTPESSTGVTSLVTQLHVMVLCGSLLLMSL